MDNLKLITRCLRWDGGVCLAVGWASAPGAWRTPRRFAADGRGTTWCDGVQGTACLTNHMFLVDSVFVAGGLQRDKTARRFRLRQGLRRDKQGSRAMEYACWTIDRVSVSGRVARCHPPRQAGRPPLQRVGDGGISRIIRNFTKISGGGNLRGHGKTCGKNFTAMAELQIETCFLGRSGDFFDRFFDQADAFGGFVGF